MKPNPQDKTPTGTKASATDSTGATFDAGEIGKIIAQMIDEIARETGRRISKEDNPLDVMDQDALLSLINRLFFNGVRTFTSGELAGNKSVENIAIAIAQLGGKPR